MKFEHQGMTLLFDGNGRQIRFYPGKETASNVPEISAPTTLFAFTGAEGSFGSGLYQCEVPALNHLKADFPEEDTIVYIHPNGLKIRQYFQPVKGAAAWRVHTEFFNEGNKNITLTNASAFSVQGMCADGLLDWEDKRKTVIHTCTQTWNGEGQWQQDSPEKLGIYHTSTHPTQAFCRIFSVGSWSTGRYYPTVMIEDRELKRIWYFSMESSGAWHFEISNRGGWTGGGNGALFIAADGADERTQGWVLSLQPGESWKSPVGVIGCCEGGFNEAAAELTRYRRTLKPSNPWPEDCAVLFNDYMDCIWADPTLEKEIALIDAAAEAGCEGYCIDAGWYGGMKESWGGGMGDWFPSQDRFGPKGLKGVLDYIRSKGMRPGVWLEIEVAADNSLVARKPDSWFLTRNGARVAQGNRIFLNFGNPEVREYLHGVIDRLVSLGCEYFKNDYNASIQNGCDNFGTSHAEGLVRFNNAFLTWIEEVKTRHPGVMIENCGSGAMRSDARTLSVFHLQSFSDQEDYRQCPSVLTGSLVNILPEQLGIWSYPWPALFDVKNDEKLLDSQNYRQKMADGEQTVFNMVNSLCGRIYLSGRIDKADDTNMALIREGVAVYKAERKHLANSVPFLPLGHKDYCDRVGFTALGLKSNGRMTLAVWRLGGETDTVTLPISAESVQTLYPSDRPAEVSVGNSTITVRLPAPWTARFLEILL